MSWMYQLSITDLTYQDFVGDFHDGLRSYLFMLSCFLYIILVTWWKKNTFNSSVDLKS